VGTGRDPPAQCSPKGFRFLHNKYPIPQHGEQDFITRLQAQGFAGFTRNDDLIFRRKRLLQHAYILAKSKAVIQPKLQF